MTSWGLALLVLGTVAVLAESHVPALGIIGGPGVVMLALGAVLAVAGLGGGVVVGVLAALVLAAISGGLLVVSLRKGATVRRRRIRAGPERLLGHVGTVQSWCETAGTVALDGGLWKARISLSAEHEDADEDEELHVGDAVVVQGLDGLTVNVRRAERWELSL